MISAAELQQAGAKDEANQTLYEIEWLGGEEKGTFGTLPRIELTRPRPIVSRGIVKVHCDTFPPTSCPAHRISRPPFTTLWE